MRDMMLVSCWGCCVVVDVVVVVARWRRKSRMKGRRISEA